MHSAMINRASRPALATDSHPNPARRLGDHSAHALSDYYKFKL